VAEIVNLRRFRKAKLRRDAGRRADENRALFGRTKGEKAAERAAKEAARAFVEGHRRERGDKET
jgi:hypothetical protein